MLEAGEQERFEVQRDLVLKAADASAITMTLNGAQAKRLGNPGQAVTIRLNPSNYKRFLIAQ
jgi:hypothetical protein